MGLYLGPVDSVSALLLKWLVPKWIHEGLKNFHNSVAPRKFCSAQDRQPPPVAVIPSCRCISDARTDDFGLGLRTAFLSPIGLEIMQNARGESGTHNSWWTAVSILAGLFSRWGAYCSPLGSVSWQALVRRTCCHTCRTRAD